MAFLCINHHAVMRVLVAVAYWIVGHKISARRARFRQRATNMSDTRILMPELPLFDVV